MRRLVLDTNIVLDLFVFRDERVSALAAALGRPGVEWLATSAMREELACVLAYPNIATRMRAAGVSAGEVLAAFDRHARVVEAPAAAKVLCRDADDQKFVDLAIAHGAGLLSKDKQVLALRRRLAVSASFAA